MQLLDAGLDVNSWDSQGSKNTPLHWAACYGNKDIIACLLGNVQTEAMVFESDVSSC